MAGVPLALITGPANAGKARLVLDAVRAELAREREPWLIVPTRADVDHYRRELAGDRAVLGVRVERFEGLLDEIVRRAGTGGEVLGEVAREQLLFGVADAREPGAARRAYAHALGELISELRERRVTPSRLKAAIERWERDEGARGARGGAGVNTSDEGAGLDTSDGGEGLDTSDGGAARADARARGRTRAGAPEGRPSCGSGADDDRDRARPLRHALRAAAEFGRYDALLRRTGLVDREQRAMEGLDELRRSPWLWGADAVLFYGFDDLTRLQLDTIETLSRIADVRVTVSLAYEPGRVAFASRAGSFHALEPLALEHTALDGRADHYAAPSRAPLGHLERSLFEPAGLRQSAGEAVRLIEGADEREELELVAEEVGELLDTGMAPEDIALVLRSPELAGDLLEEVFAGAGIPIAFERARRFADTATGASLIAALRAAGAPGDVEDGGDARGGDADDVLAWLRTPGLLERPELADRLELRARRTGARTAARTRALWEEENWPLDTLARLADARSPRTLLSRALEVLERAFSASRTRSARVLDDDELAEARAFAAGRRALEELAQLARVQPRLAPRDANGLAEALARLTIRVGEGAGDGSVAVLSPLSLRARRVRAVFLCCLQAGVFPAAERPRPVLGVEERRRLAEHSSLRLADHADALGDERYLFYAAVSRPEVALALSWHRARESGETRARSPFVDDVCDLFDAELREGRIRRATRPRRAARPRARSEDSAAESATRLPRAGATAVTGDQLLGDTDTHVWSASSLALWMSCPVRWLVERVLRTEELEPQREPLARGLVAHAALKETLEALEKETGSARVTRASLAVAHKHLAEALDTQAEQTPLSAAPERRAALRRRLAADLERYLAHAAASAATSDGDAGEAGDESTGDRADGGARGALEPRYLELEFGLAEDSHPPLDLGGGVRLRGRIDRVDVDGAGAAVVLDYKASSGTPAAKWVQERAVQVPLYMRAVRELLDLDVVGGFYQPLSGDLRARGALARDGGVALATVGSDLRDREELNELVDACVAAVVEAAGEAARGELEPRPQTCSPRGCSYPGICRCER
jgi:PD-(D/E)XK nuclease superfamily